jgi:L-proline---[L-prolyl-carrier protein] ligase
VHGPTVMQGYWGDAERSERVLAPLPAAGFGQDPVYRTGDLVRERSDGALLFLGRRDAQVKRRGYRIELGEIERALEAHDAVLECAARAEPDELAGTRITAYVVVREEVDEADLLAACLERIPRYAVPDAFAFMGALPKTSTGKIDRQALVGS